MEQKLQLLQEQLAHQEQEDNRSAMTKKSYPDTKNTAIKRLEEMMQEVQSSGDHLHTGEFVETRIEIGKIDKALAVPADALYQSEDGDWTVFVQEAPERYRRIEVTLKEDLGEGSVIEGVDAGARVVVKGAFFLNSELAKAGFEEGHH